MSGVPGVGVPGVAGVPGVGGRDPTSGLVDGFLFATAAFAWARVIVPLGRLQLTRSDPSGGEGGGVEDGGGSGSACAQGGDGGGVGDCSSPPAILGGDCSSPATGGVGECSLAIVPGLAGFRLLPALPGLPALLGRLAGLSCAGLYVCGELGSALSPCWNSALGASRTREAARFALSPLEGRLDEPLVSHANGSAAVAFVFFDDEPAPAGGTLPSIS